MLSPDGQEVIDEDEVPPADRPAPTAIDIHTSVAGSVKVSNHTGYFPNIFTCFDQRERDCVRVMAIASTTRRTIEYDPWNDTHQLLNSSLSPKTWTRQVKIRLRFPCKIVETERPQCTYKCKINLTP